MNFSCNLRHEKYTVVTKQSLVHYLIKLGERFEGDGRGIGVGEWSKGEGW